METALRVLDIREKEVDETKPPSFPTPSSTPTGFPQHEKRSRVSAFKQQRLAKSDAATQTDTAVDASLRGLNHDAVAPQAPRPTTEEIEADAKRAIDRENRATLDAMSAEDVAAAHRDLYSSLDSHMIQMLLRRAKLNENKAAPPLEPSKSCPTEASSGNEQRQDQDDTTNGPPDASPSEAGNFAPNTTHFPLPRETLSLDPADPNFLASLHEKYFPNLVADPSRLAWMAPLPTPDSAADRDSPYHPGQAALPVSQLRFDFQGRLLPPRTSRAIPVTRGLHHHSEAPEAAGYTVPELARLARSVVAAQRCIAFCTLGRMLYRLGKGDWGLGDTDDLALGLWRCISEQSVLGTLGEAAGAEDGPGTHRSVKAYAVEALWLYDKGGWKKKWRGL